MLELFGTLFSSIFAGGATGLLGVLVQRYFDHKNRELDKQLEAQRQTHELSMRDKDAAIMAQEWAGRTQVADIEAAATVNAADAVAFGESFKLEPKQYSSNVVKPTKGQSWVLVLVDALRGIVRPGLTVYLCAITTLIYSDAQLLLNKAQGMTATEALDLTKMVVSTVLYLTTTCVLWWFGTRNKQSAPQIAK